MIKGGVRLARWLERLYDVPLLFMRFAMGYAFWPSFWFKATHPGAFKLYLIDHNFFLAGFTGVLTTVVQGLGVVCLPLGFCTRIVSLMLFIQMLVAIFGVHLGDGFSGIELPVYYALLLLSTFIWGGGRISLDELFFHKKKRKAKSEGKRAG